MATYKMQSSNPSGYDNKIAGLYDLGETLGSGHFAIVKLAKHVFTGEKVAVKIVDKTKLDEVSKAHLFQEVRCMKLVQHPHVVRLYEVIDTQTKLYLVLELGDGGDLYDYIMKHEGGLTEDLAKKYFGQIVQAISYCHQLHVVHRDLKPENVVFFEKLGIVKLTDFGFSNKFLPGQKLETSCGSLAYSAPEILLGDSYDAPAVDIWSLGVILYMLVCGQPPFEKANDSETLTMIMDCKYTIPGHVSTACKNLIASMLVRDPEKRSTLKQISSDIWLTANSTCDASEYQPLVNTECVEDEDHLFILQKMINGNIAAKEEILQALKSEKYNHIAATYFLLAERRLRQKRIDEIQKNPDIVKTKNTLRFPSLLGIPVIAKCNELLVPENSDVELPIAVTESRNPRRIRKCSIVKEEEDEDDLSDCGAELKSTLSRRGSRSEGRINVNLQNKIYDMKLDAITNQPTTANVIEPPCLNQPNIIIVNQSQCSANDSFFEASKGNTDIYSESNKSFSPSLNVSLDNILGKINSNSSESENAESTSKQKIKLKTKNPILNHRRNKLTQSRTPSCSSSEASDDDSKSKKKKSANITDAPPNRLYMHRRDSHDDSDSQDQSNFTSTSRNTLSQTVYSSTASEKGSSNNNNQQDCKKNGKTKNTKQKKQEQTNSRTMRCMERKRALEMRLRESQSLDRICEIQEYEQRFRNPNKKVQNQIYDLGKDSHKKLGPATKNNKSTQYPIQKCNDDEISQTLNNDVDVYLKTDKDIILEIKVTKGISTGSRYSRAIKKIRQLKKYFPVVNFS